MVASDVQRTWCKLIAKNKFIYAFVGKFSLLNIYQEWDHWECGEETKEGVSSYGFVLLKVSIVTYVN
jgi:hypothetical protein